MVKGGKNESNTLGKGWGMFPLTPSPLPQNAGFGGYLGGGGRRRRLGAALVGMSEVKKRRVGEKRPARAQDIGLVAPARMARQGGPRHRRRGAAMARAASVATCRATCTGATEAICRAGESGATKQTTSCT